MKKSASVSKSNVRVSEKSRALLSVAALLGLASTLTACGDLAVDPTAGQVCSASVLSTSKGAVTTPAMDGKTFSAFNFLNEAMTAAPIESLPSVSTEPKISSALISQNTSGDVSAFAAFTVAGLAQYEYYEPTTTGGSQMDYGSKQIAPIRRATVQIMNGTTVLATGVTNDTGNYSIAVDTTPGTTLFVRVLSRTTVTSNTRDGLGGAMLENCLGASWDVRVVDNVTGNSASQNNASLRPIYALDSSTFSSPASGTEAVNPTAAMNFNGTIYTSRAGAPFRIMDIAVASMETACQGRANINFPLVYINWSEDNTPSSGNRYQGFIGTSFFTTETSALVANLYILGAVGSDTDELDSHVVTHEFGHYLENKIYRSDSIGGNHSLTDSLDPRLAFGEGFGNAFSAIVQNDPLYIDTSGAAQGSGFSINVSTAPSTANNRGYWSETSMQYMIYQFWQSRGSYDRIHNILETYQKVSDAVTSGLTFVSFYASVYGQTADALTTTWTGAGALSSPINSLCTGSCAAGTPVYSPFDLDNDLGSAFASTRGYNQAGSNSFAAAFWQMYRPLSSGTNAATAHDQIALGGYTLNASNLNKLGLRRLYTVTATGTSTTVRVASITQSGVTCSNSDRLDMAVYRRGVLVGLDEAASGGTASCPSVTFCSTPGQTYIVEIAGFGTVGAYTLSVSP